MPIYLAQKVNRILKIKIVKNNVSSVISLTCLAALLISAPLVLPGCSEAPNHDVTPQGTIVLDKIVVGIPESTLEKAQLSFVKDEKGTGFGKTQYLSRQNNSNGGQYIVQCKDGTVFQVSTLFSAAPVSKETAEAELKKLLPKDAPAQSKVEDQPGKQVYTYGANYIGEVILKPADKGAAPMASQVTMTTLDANGKAGAPAAESSKAPTEASKATKTK